MESQTLTWTPNTISAKALYKALDASDREYDIDPPHQRGVVHPTAWKRGIIDSMSGIAPADIPATYWQPRDTVDGIIYESVDGKQRTDAIRSYMDNEFTWNGQFYNKPDKKSLERHMKNKLDRFLVTLKRANRPLTPDELATSFKKFQQTKTTKLGEILHATKGVLTTTIDSMMTEHTILINKLYSTSSQKRFAHLSDYAKCLWCEINISNENLNAGTVPVPKTKKVKDMWDKQLNEDYTPISQDKMTEFKHNMLYTLQILNSKNNDTMGQKTSKGIPIYMIMKWSATKGLEKQNEHRDYLKKSLASIWGGVGNVGGNHDSAMARFKFIKGTLPV